MKLEPKKLFGLCYALAAALWLAWCVAGCAVMLYHKSGANMPQQTLAAGDLTFESFVNYADLEWDTPPDDDPRWYLSTDNDPKIFWEGEGYLEKVTLLARHRYPAGSVVLYYLLPGQTDYSETQKIYAAVTGEGEYTFDLGGKVVAGLRIDPDSAGGVPTLFDGVVLNPAEPWFWRFWPRGGAWAVLLGGPALVASLLQAVCQAAAALKELRKGNKPWN